MTRRLNIRRTAGLVARARADLALDQVKDPRRKQGQRWTLPALLTVALTAIMAGCGSAADAERLTEQLSLSIRRKLGIRRRLPDTTLRRTLMMIPLSTLRRLLRRQVRIAHRRKALRPVGLPWGVVAVDGKYTATNLPDDVYAQKQGEGFVVRTLTCSLVSAPASVCLDAVPVRASDNEMSAFPEALKALLEHYSRADLFRLISVDAGFASAANASLIGGAKLKYLIALKGNQKELSDEAVRLLGNLPDDAAEAETRDWTGCEMVIRCVWRTTEMAAYNGWSHLRTVVRVESERLDADANLVARESRYFASNLDADELTPEQWLRLVRAHWVVEISHQTLDVALKEDEHPWFRDAYGMLVAGLLRRIAYNILVLFRNVSLRGESKGRPATAPWRELLEWMRTTLVAATDADLHGLRWHPRVRATAPPAPA